MLSFDDEPPASLRFQRYQFAHLAGRFRERSYRSELRVRTPESLEDCFRLLPKLAKRMKMRNGAVDKEDLIQIGWLVLLEGHRELMRRSIEPRRAAWKSLLERAQAAMFHAIDQKLIGFDLRHGGDGEEEESTQPWEATLQPIYGHSTVVREGGNWEFHPSVCEAWGAPLPPGSCQPRPTSLCCQPRHLPIVQSSAERIVCVPTSEYEALVEEHCVAA